jgi:hypothetical protein
MNTSSKKNTKQLDETLGDRLITSTYNESTVHDTVDSWNWNMNIFEIYDEIKDWREIDQRNVCRYACQYFKDKDSTAQFNDLCYHLTGNGVA